MTDAFSPKTNPKVENPATHFDKPTDVVRDKTLSADEIRKALNTWDQDARQLLTASNEACLEAGKVSSRMITTASARSFEPRPRSVKSRRTNRLNK
jgi:hypothetical protein